MVKMIRKDQFLGYDLDLIYREMLKEMDLFLRHNLALLAFEHSRLKILARWRLLVSVHLSNKLPLNRQSILGPY